MELLLPLVSHWPSGFLPAFVSNSIFYHFPKECVEFQSHSFVRAYLLWLLWGFPVSNSNKPLYSLFLVAGILFLQNNYLLTGHSVMLLYTRKRIKLSEIRKSQFFRKKCPFSIYRKPIHLLYILNEILDIFQYFNGKCLFNFSIFSYFPGFRMLHKMI